MWVSPTSHLALTLSYSILIAGTYYDSPSDPKPYGYTVILVATFHCSVFPPVLGLPDPDPDPLVRGMAPDPSLFS
jgi:hypothetical protein